MRRRIIVLLVAAAVLSGCGAEQAPREAAHTGEDAPADVGDAVTESPAGDPDEPVSNDPADQPVSDQPGSATPGPSTGGTSGSSRGSTGSAGGGSQPNQGAGAVEPGAGDGEDRLTQPRPGQANVRARRWESADVHPDDVTIDIAYWSGVEPCYVLDRVEVREEAARVVITLYEGSQPGFDGACTEQAVERTTRIRLAAPLRDRALVDGSSPA